LSDTLVVRSRAFSSELREAAVSVENSAWSRLGYLNFTEAHQEYYDSVLDRFSDLQLCLVQVETNTPVALANCVPAYWHGDFDDLPSEGWDWLLERGATHRGGRANVLGALAISVPPEQRGRGFAARMIDELCVLSRRHGFEAMLAPVRPTSKCDFPRVPIEEYIRWKDADGRLFDPWLRSHLSHGGKIVRPCERSMVVEQHIAFWETWAGRRFEASGEYLLDGALSPINIDVERQIGRYEEPNVWVAYSS
jgi:GNAT superfamily N-acetyltransferase